MSRTPFLMKHAVLLDISTKYQHDTTLLPYDNNYIQLLFSQIRPEQPTPQRALFTSVFPGWIEKCPPSPTRGTANSFLLQKLSLTVFDLYILIQPPFPPLFVCLFVSVSPLFSSHPTYQPLGPQLQIHPISTTLVVALSSCPL